jgi:hypothetical protein
LLEDPDFEAFRASTQGKALLKDAQSLRDTWLELAKTGVPILAYVPHTLVMVDGLLEAEHQRPDWFRAGAWLENAQRFLPVLPATPRPLGAIVDLQTGRGVVIDANVNPCHFDYCPRLDRIQLFDFGKFVPTTPVRPAVTLNELDYRSSGLDVELTASGPRWLENENLNQAWYEVIDGLPGRAKVQSTLARGLLHIGVLGGYLTHLADGWTRDKRHLVLPDGRRWKLPAREAFGHLQLVELPKRNQAILVTVREGCECTRSEHTFLDYSVKILDLTTLTLSPWDAAPGIAAIYVDREGGIYLQRNDRLERFENAGANEPSRRLPKGLLLSPPMISDGNCCGL